MVMEKPARGLSLRCETNKTMASCFRVLLRNSTRHETVKSIYIIRVILAGGVQPANVMEKRTRYLFAPTKIAPKGADYA
jgi:hypothetical protein